MQGAIARLERDMSRMQEDLAQIRRIAEARSSSEPVTLAAQGSGANPSGIGLVLPPEVIVHDPAEVESYLDEHPELTAVVSEMAAALVQEFRDERSEIELVRYQDPEIDDHYLAFYVRLPIYGEQFIPRIKSVMRAFDDRRAGSDGWVVVTSDFEPVE
jgi:hypothetical protein